MKVREVVLELGRLRLRRCERRAVGGERARVRVQERVGHALRVEWDVERWWAEFVVPVAVCAVVDKVGR